MRKPVALRTTDPVCLSHIPFDPPSSIPSKLDLAETAPCFPFDGIRCRQSNWLGFSSQILVSPDFPSPRNGASTCLTEASRVHAPFERQTKYFCTCDASNQFSEAS